MSLNDTFTSTGAKFFAHQEVMANLRNGKGQPVVTHVMLTDVCNHTCAFCSVQARAGDSLPFDDVLAYLDILRRFGLKAVILSGGGNPILYKCRRTGKNFNDVVDAIHVRGLEIGLITNGMEMKEYAFNPQHDVPLYRLRKDVKLTIRESWRTVRPETLDKLTWVRISMSGLDHDEGEVYVPDIDPARTTLGFSYVGHTIFQEPADPHHGKVSTKGDLITIDRSGLWEWSFESRIGELTEKIGEYVKIFHPKYVRLLPDCLAPKLIPQRCEQLGKMARVINCEVGKEVVFVQSKPPQAPNVCLIGAIHPVLNCDGFVYPCDAVVLAAAERGYREGKPNHKFDDPWRICHWSEIGKLYEGELPRSLIHNPGEQCRGCVFTTQNLILEGVRDGTVIPTPPTVVPEHSNFV